MNKRRKNKKMVDTTKYAEGNNLTVEVVKNSPSKQCVVIGEAKPETTDYGEKLTVIVEIDGKQKTWRMNRDSVKNMQELGLDSRMWNAAIVKLKIVSISGKDSIIGVPMTKPEADPYAKPQ